MSQDDKRGRVFPFDEWWETAGFKQYHAVDGKTVAKAAWDAAITCDGTPSSPRSADLARVERERDSALRACCAGNTDDDEPVRCQSYEASEQGQPCPRGRCVMAEPEDAPTSAKLPTCWLVAVEEDGRMRTYGGLGYRSLKSAQEDVALPLARGQHAEIWECYVVSSEGAGS